MLQQLQTPEQKFKAVCEMLGVKTEGFTIDEMLAAHPELKDKGALQNAIHAADNFMADGANFVNDTYQEFKANNPQAAAVVEWVATKSMMMLYVASLFTPAGLAVAGAVELAELTGLTDYAKENLTAGLKSVGFERSAEGMSALVVGLVQSKGGKKVGGLASTSKTLNSLLDKVKSGVETNLQKYTTAIRGGLGEAATRAVQTYKGYTSLNCRLPGNKGIDHVFVKYNIDGTVKEIIVVESKFAANGGAPKLSWSGSGRARVQQLSPGWMKKQMDILKESHPENK